MFDADVLDAVGERFPKAVFAAEFTDQVDIFQTAEPGVGQRHAPDADAFQDDDRPPVAVGQFGAGIDLQGFAAEERKVGIQIDQQLGAGDVVGEIDHQTLGKVGAFGEQGIQLALGQPDPALGRVFAIGLGCGVVDGWSGGLRCVLILSGKADPFELGGEHLPLFLAELDRFEGVGEQLVVDQPDGGARGHDHGDQDDAQDGQAAQLGLFNSSFSRQRSTPRFFFMVWPHAKSGQMNAG